jgi:N-acetylglutamate synthase-like GNAT family acetyltransferase
MNVREATEGDGEEIHDIARQSIQASYAISPTAIDVIVEEWFDARTIDERLGQDDRVIAVAETDERIIGFADGNASDGELRWLHVHPEERGRGAGTELFEWMRDTLTQDATDLQVRILAKNSEGDAFVTRFGYERVDQRDIDFGGETWREHVYSTVSEDEQGTTLSEPEDVPSEISVDGEEIFIDSDDGIPGDVGAFYPLYHDESHEQQYGFYCSNCDSTVETVDELDRIKCTECGNVHRPDEWDEAYL